MKPSEVFFVMAENKKSFVIYCDLIHTMNHLSIEQRGLVFTWLLEYVNDLNPEPLDGLLGAVVEPLKQQLKRDLKKYERRAENSRKNGSRGGRPPKPKKPTGLNSEKQEPKKPVSVNVNDNVTVSVSDIIINRNRIENYLNSSFTWHESIIRSLKSKHGFQISLEEIKKWIVVFCDELEAADDLYKTDHENKKHFLHWIAKQLKQNKKPTESTTTKKSRNERTLDHNMETAKELGLDKELGS